MLFFCNYLCVTVTVGLLPLLSSFPFLILPLPTSLLLFPSSAEAVLTRSLNNRKLSGVLEAGPGPGEYSYPGLQTITSQATREFFLPIVTGCSIIKASPSWSCYVISPPPSVPPLKTSQEKQWALLHINIGQMCSFGSWHLSHICQALPFCPECKTVAVPSQSYAR